MCFKTLCSTTNFFSPKEGEKNSQQFFIKYAWQGTEENLSLWDLIPMAQIRKVQRQLLCFENNSW